MTTDALPWYLWLLPASTLLVLSLYPLWVRWNGPHDKQARSRSSAAAHGQQAVPMRHTLHLPPGTRFEHIQAEKIVLGADAIPLPAPLPNMELWQPPKDARPWAMQGWHVAHALDIPPGQRVPCAPAVRGPLHVCGPGLLEGDIRVRDSLRLGPNCHVRGNLLSGGDIRIGQGCSVRGLVLAEGKLHLSPGVVIGSPLQLVSVCADVIQADGPVQIHGTVHARIHGNISL